MCEIYLFNISKLSMRVYLLIKFWNIQGPTLVINLVKVSLMFSR